MKVTPSFASACVARVVFDIGPRALPKGRVPCRGHKFSGDIKGLVSVEKAGKAPFLLAYMSRFLYPVKALHANGPGP